jgi:LAO/AO transport system kinase
MKAGLLEIADILVVNKADRDGAERTEHELSAALALRATPGDVPVMRTSALSGLGVGELWRQLAEKARWRMADGLEARRRRRARYLIARAAADLIALRIRKGDRDSDALADAVLAGRMAPLMAARRILGLIPSE